MYKFFFVVLAGETLENQHRRCSKRNNKLRVPMLIAGLEVYISSIYFSLGMTCYKFLLMFFTMKHLLMLIDDHLSLFFY